MLEQRSASSPIPAQSSEVKRPTFASAGPSRSTSARRHGPRATSTRRYTPAPLLDPDLQLHQVYDSSTSATLPRLPSCEKKHAGAQALRRIFVGPHKIVNADLKGKGLASAVGHHEHEEELDDSFSESSSSSDDGEMSESTRQQKEHHKRLKLRAKLERRDKRQRVTSGQTFGSDLTSTSHKPMHKWTGGTFEIGGDVREAAERRKAAQQRRASTSRNVSSTLGAPGIASGSYEPALPPKHVVDRVPELAFPLMRRRSDAGDLETASLGPEPAPPKPLRPKGSKLGFGLPSSSASMMPLTQSLSPDSETFAPPPSAMRTPQEPTHPGDQKPAPAEEVLARRMDKELSGMKKKVTFPVHLGHKEKPGKFDVLRKERMLVRAEWTEREDLPSTYDEKEARRYKTVHRGWEEYAVVWHPRRIELWTEYGTPGKQMLVGHPKLAHTIPLSPSSHTKLSLYSNSDFVFCLVHRPSPSTLSSIATSRGGRTAPTTGDDDVKSKKAHSGVVHFRHTGTNIFVFRPRSNKVAKEWMWEIHRALGGSLPKTIEIVVPSLNARITLPVPDEPIDEELFLDIDDDEGRNQGYRFLTPSAVVKACVNELAKVKEWEDVIKECEHEGVVMKLAWRRGETLDWVGDSETEWAVMGGCIMAQPHYIPTLELRPAMHYPTTVRIPSTKTVPSTRLSEPPSLEGYLIRIRTNGSSERIYLSSYDSHIFLCRPSTAFPPDPPLPAKDLINNPAALVIAPFILAFGSIGKKDSSKTRLWERVFGAREQQLSSKLVQRVTGRRRSSGSGQSARSVKVDGRSAGDDSDADAEVDIMQTWLQSERARLKDQLLAAKGFVNLQDITKIERAKKEGSGDEVEVVFEGTDLGGQEGLDASQDEATLHRQRSFVITTSSGYDVRFECHSIAVCSEWIGRLDALRTYWIRRSRTDAIEQMEMQPVASVQKAPRRRAFPQHRDVTPVAALDETFPLLPRIYNWCVLECCRSILLSGRVYVKRGMRGTFRERYLFLLSGVLLEYQTRRRNMHGQPTKLIYHQRKFIMSLRGCYVYSGRLANQIGPSSTTSWDPGSGEAAFPRMYGEDGLRTADEDEDCTLAIFKKTAESRELGKKGNLTIIRARSIMERDEWIFRLNAAIESLRNAEAEREERLKDFSWLKKKE